MPNNCSIGIINPTKKTCEACGYRCTEEGFRAFLIKDTRRAVHKAHAKIGRDARKKERFNAKKIFVLNTN